VRLRPQVPDAVRAVPVDEHRLAWGVTDGGLALVATPSALWVGETKLPWLQVEKAGWQPPVLTVVEVSEREGAGTRHVWTLADDRRLAETVRAQVTSSVAWSDVRRLQPAGKVRVVGRRVPGQDALLWQVVYLEGTNPADPVLRAQADAFAASLRATLG
jgi:hypothetical protein